MTRPLVSVVLPVRDVLSTIQPALQSVLRQDLEDFELLVLDDGSTDGTPARCHELSGGDPRVQVVADGESRGLPARLNQGIAMARGELLARMDGDDVAYPTRLRRQVELLQRAPDVDLVGSSVAVFADGGALRGVRLVPEQHNAICRRPDAGFPLAHPTYVGRTAWFRRYGYDPRAVRCEDQDLLLRSYRDSRFANLSDVLLGYREGAVHLGKTRLGRRNFAAAVARDARRHHALHRVPVAAGGQLVKAVVDAVAVTTGTESRLLAHRARPAAPHVAKEWEDVWRWAVAP